MPTRKNFIAATAAVPLLAAAPRSPAPSPTASPAPSPSKKKTSALAREIALKMRTFDPRLTDRQLHDIAVGIDENMKTGARVNPEGRALKNWDEPVTTFEVAE